MVVFASVSDTRMRNNRGCKNSSLGNSFFTVTRYSTIYNSVLRSVGLGVIRLYFHFTRHSQFTHFQYCDIVVTLDKVFFLTSISHQHSVCSPEPRQLCRSDRAAEKGLIFPPELCGLFDGTNSVTFPLGLAEVPML